MSLLGWSFTPPSTFTFSSVVISGSRPRPTLNPSLVGVGLDGDVGVTSGNY